MKLSEFIDAALTKEMFALDEAVHSFYEVFDTDNQSGLQLDVAGQILMCPRQGISDELYRMKLNAYKIRNSSQGTIEDITNVLKAITGASHAELTYSEGGQVALAVSEVLPPYISDNFRAFIESTLLDGVELLSIAYSGNDNSFVFSKPGGTSTPGLGGKGFSSIANPTKGGIFTFLIVR